MSIKYIIQYIGAIILFGFLYLLILCVGDMGGAEHEEY